MRYGSARRKSPYLMEVMRFIWPGAGCRPSCMVCFLDVLEVRCC